MEVETLATALHDSDMGPGIREVVEAANALAALLEASGEYYYDVVNEKSWALGSGGASGNCEGCVGNSEMGWILDELPFSEGDQDVDSPPLHPHCDCGIDYRERRVRVYV